MKLPFIKHPKEVPSQPKSKVELLKTSIDHKIAVYSKKKTKNHAWAFTFHLIVAILTASTTLLSGILEPGFLIGTIGFFSKPIEIGVHDLILCISALLFLTNALMAFLNNRDGYTIFRKGLNQMRRLKTELNYYLLENDAVDSKELDNFLKQYMEIVQFVDSSHEETHSSDTD